MNCQYKGSFFDDVVKNVQNVIYMITVSLALASVGSFAVHAYDVGVKNPATDRAASTETSTMTPYATNARGSQANIQVFGARSRSKISYDIHKYAGKKGLPVVGQNADGKPGTLITDVTTKDNDALDETVAAAAASGAPSSFPSGGFASLFRPTPSVGSASPSLGSGFVGGGSTGVSSGGGSTGESSAGASSAGGSTGASSVGGSTNPSLGGGTGGLSLTPSVVLAQVPVVGTGALFALAIPLLLIARVRRSK